MKRFISRLLPVVVATLVFGLLATPEGRAQSPKKVIVLRGGDSAVSSGISKARKRVNGKDLITTARERKEKLKTPEEERKETKRRLRAQLVDADAVVADLSAPPTSEDDGLLVEAAIEEGVPVVLENTDSAKMASLTGAIGVEAATVVIESRAEGGELQVTIVDGPPLQVQSGPGQVTKKPTAQPVPVDPKLKAALAQYDAQQKAARANAPKPANVPEVSKLTSAQKAAKVEELISEKAFKKGVERHGLLTGKCTAATVCREGIVAPALQSFCPGGVCSTANSLAPAIEWGVYKTVTQNPTTGVPRNAAYIVTRAAGRPNIAMAWDEERNRGYYLEGWNIQLSATFPANMGWIMDRAKPLNANNKATTTYTSGFSLGATTDKAITFTYNDSVSRSMETQEFGVTRTTTGNSLVTWATKMQMNGNGEAYSQPSDLFIHWFFDGTKVNLLPTIAKTGTDFHAEAIWWGYRDAACGSCSVTIKPTVSLQMYRVWPEWMDNGEYGYWAEHVEPATVTSPILPITFTTSW